MSKRSSTLPERIAILVEKAGGQRPLARILGVADGTIIGWLGGSEPYQRTLSQIAERTGVNIDWLRDGVGEPALEDFSRRVAESPRPSEPPTSNPHPQGMPPEMQHCRRIIEHLTRNLSTEHFTEAQLGILRDSAISAGERERFAGLLSEILSSRLASRHRQKSHAN